MKFFVIGLIASIQAASPTRTGCPSIDTTCRVNGYKINPYDAGDDICWFPMNRSWTCQRPKNGKTCPPSDVDVTKCTYKPSKMRCPMNRDICIVDDMLLTIEQAQARYWKTTKHAGAYLCTNERYGNLADWIDITKC